MNRSLPHHDESAAMPWRYRVTRMYSSRHGKFEYPFQRAWRVGDGTSAASLAMNATGSHPAWLVPSRRGELSW
jgi:hypothetical protein